MSTDTVRFYERSGWLPRPARRDNDYREYGDPDVEHLRLLIDLRRWMSRSRTRAGSRAGATPAIAPTRPRNCRGSSASASGHRRSNRRTSASTLGSAGSSATSTRPRRALQIVDTPGRCCDAADAVVETGRGWMRVLRACFGRGTLSRREPLAVTHGRRACCDACVG